MKTQDLIEHLEYSSLKGLYRGDDKKDYVEHQLLSWINRSVQKIYSDLNLSVTAKRFYIEEGKQEYTFPDKYMSIISAYKANGLEAPLNLEDRRDSIFNTKPFTVMIPDVYVGSYVDIIYKESIDKITKEGNIPLENQYLEAIMMYISYIANELIDISPKYQHQSFLSKYNMELQLLKTNGLVPQDGIVNHKIYLKGFI